MRVLPVFAPGERVVVALSGGADSVALLLALVEQASCHLTAAHLNHGIRGEEADRDQAFVRALCARKQVPLIEETCPVPALARDRHLGLETAAREARRAFLLRAMQRAGATAIATAHHMDDQAETVLMHLCRGSGARGAGGMRARDGCWAKPLLETPKRDIVSFLQARGEAYCLDATNDICDTPRNAIRQRVLPALVGIYPGAVRAIGRHARLAAGEDDCLAAMTEQLLRTSAEHMPFGARLRADDAHPALIRRALRALTGEDAEMIFRLESLYQSPRGAIETVRMRYERTGQYLYLIDRAADRPWEAVPLRDGAAIWRMGQLRVERTGPVPILDDRYSQVLDERALEGAVLRTRRPGDRMHKLGAPGARSLGDIMIDAKLDRPLRDYWPVIARDRDILWLPGVAIAEGAAITEDTMGACRLTWMKEDLSWKTGD